jgi:hypothetical protein
VSQSPWPEPPASVVHDGIRIQAWSLLLVAILGILSRCQSLRDLERTSLDGEGFAYAIHHAALTGVARHAQEGRTG